jgi:cell division septation protein DedD
MSTQGRRRLAGAVVVVALAVAGLAGLGLQALGQPANHPQIEMAHSVVSRLDGGASPSDVVPAGTVDIAMSNVPYVIVTNARHEVLASSASLSGQSVLPPPGVFDSVTANGEDRVTWQPAAGVRSWIVVDTYKAGFVIAGRSPSDAEQSEYLLQLWGSFGALALAGVAAAGLVVMRLSG